MQTEVGATIGACIPIILCPHFTYMHLRVEDAESGEGELSDKVCEIDDAPASFKAFWFSPCQHMWNEKENNMQSLTDHN